VICISHRVQLRLRRGRSGVDVSTPVQLAATRCTQRHRRCNYSVPLHDSLLITDTMTGVLRSAGHDRVPSILDTDAVVAIGNTTWRTRLNLWRRRRAWKTKSIRRRPCEHSRRWRRSRLETPTRSLPRRSAQHSVSGTPVSCTFRPRTVANRSRVHVPLFTNQYKLISAKVATLWSWEGNRGPGQLTDGFITDVTCVLSV